MRVLFVILFALGILTFALPILPDEDVAPIIKAFAKYDEQPWRKKQDPQRAESTLRTTSLKQAVEKSAVKVLDRVAACVLNCVVPPELESVRRPRGRIKPPKQLRLDPSQLRNNS